MTIQALTEAVAAVCPSSGVSVGRWDDKATWRVDALPEATHGQRDAAQAVLAGWVVPTALDEAKAAYEARVRAYRWEQHNKVTFGGKVFASDDTAATRLVAAITARTIAQAAGLEPTNAAAKWEAMDGTMVTMTLNEQRQLLLTGVARTQACFDRQAILLTAGNAAPDQAALDAIDIDAGWPA